MQENPIDHTTINEILLKRNENHFCHELLQVMKNE